MIIALHCEYIQTRFGVLLGRTIRWASVPCGRAIVLPREALVHGFCDDWAKAVRA